MGVLPPSEEDLGCILRELDDDFDGSVSKEEFCELVMLVIGKMLETEEELQSNHNQGLKMALDNMISELKLKKKKEIEKENRLIKNSDSDS